jgi:hypothetical protein
MKAASRSFEDLDSERVVEQNIGAVIQGEMILSSSRIRLLKENFGSFHATHQSGTNLRCSTDPTRRDVAIVSKVTDSYTRNAANSLVRTS